MELPTHRINL